MPDPPKITVDTVTTGPKTEIKSVSPADLRIEAQGLLDGADSVHPGEEEDEKHKKSKKKKTQAGREPDGLQRDTSKYPLSINQLNTLVDPKNAYVLECMGGVDGLAEMLKTNLDSGLSSDAQSDSSRLDAYGRNVLPIKKPKSLFQLMWIALQDKVLIILSVAAIVSLALGLYETFGQPPDYDAEGHALPRVEWVEGVAILVAIAIVVFVGAGNDWQREKQFVKLNEKKTDRKVKVERNGAPLELSIYDVQVGDLFIIEPGELVPVDGVLVRGFDIKCDESAATGESETVKKVLAAEALVRLQSGAYEPGAKQLDCFLVSGSKVIEGTGVFLVTAVGKNSMYGRTIMALDTEAEATPLQEKLNDIAENIAKLGILAATLLFVVLFIRFLTELGDLPPQTPSKKGQNFLDIFIVAITIIVVAVPEGLPLAVTLALAFATTRMLKDNNLVRVLKSCETMGGATTVCSDKTGTLTQNRMTVVAVTIGENTEIEISHDSDAQDPSKTPVNVLQQLQDTDRQLLLDSIALNSSAFESSDPEDLEHYVGSKTETALLNFARLYMGLEEGTLASYRREHNIVKVYPFDSARKYMATLYEKDGKRYLLVKGASEVVLSKCKAMIGGGEFTAQAKDKLLETIDTYASNSLRTIGIVYKPVADTFEPSADDLANETGFTFVAVTGIKDPLRPGVRQAVQDCRDAGVVVRMVTGDNINTARAIALDCGILSGPEDTGIVIEGPAFRKLDSAQQKRVVKDLRVMARSSPEDKRRLVKLLKSQGETVAVTGDGTNDAPALKLADVGFSMGIAGTEVAKEASEIILMDDNFGSIVKAIMWGRTVNDAVKKFLQFQLTVNITAVLLTFISAVANRDNKSVLTAVQLLWVNLIMDTFAALALATDPPSPTVLKRAPDARGVNLISPTMWKMILGQAVLQLVVTLVLHFAGPSIWANSSRPDVQEQLSAMVFNTFVWMQWFNIFVNRRLDNGFNFLTGLFKNYFFLAIVAIIGGGQVLIMFVGGAAFSVSRQTGVQWAVAIIGGFLSVPTGILLRLIPDSLLIRIFPARLFRFIERSYIKVTSIFRKDSTHPSIQVEDEESSLQADSKWNPAIEQVREELVFLKKFKGGRLSNLKFRPKQIYRRMIETLSPSSSPSTLSPSTTTVGPDRPYVAGGFLAPPTPPTRSRRTSGSSIGALTVVPGIIGGAVGGAWRGD